MLLKRLLNEGRLKPHKTSSQEIKNLLKLIERDIADAKIKGISTDRRFTIAYNAVLQLATILLYCEGYRTKGEGHHFITFQVMKEILGKNYYNLADYFDSCRAKRNITDYAMSDEISETEVEELIEEVEKFKLIVLNWVKQNYMAFL